MKYGQNTVDQIRFIMGRGNPVPANAPAADWHDTHGRETLDWITAIAGTKVADPSAPPGSASARSPRRQMPAGGRARRVVAPVTAALAVAGVIAGVTLGASSGNSPRISPGVSSGSPLRVSQAARTGSLPLLRTDARFGWLPAGEQLRSGFEGATEADMNIAAGKVFEWDLTTWAAGYCVVNRSATEELVCGYGKGVSPARYPVRSRAPSINGHEAFWTTPNGHEAFWTGSPKEHQEITWEYAPGAWAVFESPSCCSAAANRQPVPTLLRIARGISFGPASGEPLSFDFQLTDIPSDWRVSSVDYGAHGGTLLANAIDVTDRHHPRIQMSILIEDGGTGNADPCWSSAAGPTKHSRLRGYDVETTTNPQADSGGGSDTYQLCANDVGGLSFSISTSDHAARTPAGLFEHMRFLGPNPANWVTNPFS